LVDSDKAVKNQPAKKQVRATKSKKIQKNQQKPAENQGRTTTSQLRHNLRVQAVVSQPKSSKAAENEGKEIKKGKLKPTAL